MKVVGLTGGIGSGKTTVAGMFSSLGIPIYIADEESKKLLRSSKVIQRKLMALFGEETYLNGTLNKPFIADKIFKDQSLLEKMNAIVHPKVGQHFKKWLKKQNAPYVIKESAILFESGAYKGCDFVVVVTAPERERISRVLKRDSTTKEKIKNIIKNQLPVDEVVQRSDFSIHNTSLKDTENQVLQVHQKIMDSL